MAKYTIANGSVLDIQVGDWVDVVDNLFKPDEKTGLSFLVNNTLDEYVELLVKLDNENYSNVILSPSYVLSNYRKVQ